MEATVRYIADQVAVVDGQTLATGSKPALCFKGKTYALGIINDSAEICAITLTLRDHDLSPIVKYGVEEYPIPKFISHIERLMMDKPISEEALALIKQWPNNPADFGDEIIADEDRPPPPPRSKKIKKANCIPVLSSEHKTTPQKIRKFLRSNGMNAPYDNETEIRRLMKNYNKERP